MTLKDIAERAGVSMMTVSNVINGKHSRVSLTTVERVNQIIRECNYVPNMTARSLTAKSSRIIGIIVSVSPRDTPRNYFDNPYVSTMMGIIETMLRKNGYYIMIRSVDGVEAISSLMKNWNVDGILFLYPFLEENFIELIDGALKEHPMPMVIFDSRTQNDNIINISSNDTKGLYLSTKYLINNGHRNIAFVADYRGNPLLEARFLGYCNALEESGIPLRRELLFPFPPTYEDGILAGQKIAEQKDHITAAVTTADISAIGVMEGARLGGLRIPADLSVVGFDDLKICNYTTPKLTTISQHVEQKAELAAKLLLEKLESGEIAQHYIQMDVELIERQSVVSLI